ncbi:Lrp/AsnC family transcriptional regulator [Parasphingorhabdus sp. JC815]|uniref:Lrp/AsnC family transcriptional regulator n=1 Tax=Parasphingorhabdus sp. JC815 TaxID=3232140 RepID=UPI00345A6CB5
MPEKFHIDRIDRKILAVLQDDGRITNHKLADCVSLSPSACLARVKRMEKNGVITGYKAQVDVAKLGQTLTIFAELTISAHDTTSRRKIENTLQEMNAAIEAYRVSGSYDYLVKFLVADMENWTAIADKLNDGELQIETIRTVPSMRRIKNWTGVPMFAGHEK